MRKQQQLQHQHPSRKSPRLSSSSSSGGAATAVSPPPTRLRSEEKPAPEARPADAWALSLHVEEQQQPLNICYPVSEDDHNSVRRSTRFTSNKFKTPPPEGTRSKKHVALVPSKLSISPIMPLSSSPPAWTLTDGENAGPKKRRRLSEGGAAGSSPEPGRRGCLSERCLRSRTVLMQVADGGDFSIEQRRLRSRVVRYAVPAESPQGLEKRREKGKAAGLIELPQDDDELCPNQHIELLALPQPTPISSQKCLRSRTVKMQLQEERSASGKKASGAKLNSKERLVTLKKESSIGESPDKEQCGREGVSERRLRSRMVRCAVAESPEKRVVRSGSGEKRLRSVSERRGKGKVAAEIAGDSSLIALPQEDELCRNEQIEMLALPQPTPISSQKRLRSRTVKMQLLEERLETSASMKNDSGVELDDKERLVTLKKESSLGESLDKEECGLEGVSEKRLRSRKIQVKQNVAKNAVRIPDLNAGGWNGESTVKSEKKEKSTACGFVGEPIPEEEAQERWQWRYDLKSRKKGKNWKINPDAEDEIILNVERHYSQAKVGNFVLDIGDCVFVKGEGSKKHIGRILEFFKTTEGKDYFRVQWFFRAEDTVLKDAASSHDKRRIFYSTLMNDNVLDCIISKVKIVKVPPMLCLKRNPVPSAAFYYDMEYSVQYSTFRTLVPETSMESESFLSNFKDPDDEPITLTPLELLPKYESSKEELALLDLYAGCGGMSTGLCLGAKLASVNLMTRWAVDYNSAACESLKLNHPETNVRNESAEDFLDLLKQWESLCKTYVSDIERTLKCELDELPEVNEACLSPSDTEESSEEYEVSHLVEICYGDPNENGKRRLHFKVRWKGYGPDDDTWEAAEGLSNYEKRIEDFVRRGFNAKILPLPGDVGVICGGPPCQGISGYNRHRNFASPLADERNRQIVVFMDIVEFLKPKHCLMENVVDIIRFDKGSLGRYALSRLVLMRYQSRLGTIASGCYGLPQFRLRVFIWGAHPGETLPQFPLPTHDVVAKYWPPIEFERNIVAYAEGEPRTLQEAIVLGDSISDLPPVKNDEEREEMPYEKAPETEFQRHIRLSKDEMTGRIPTGTPRAVLFDHRPLKLSEHDYMRVCQIPHRKGANFRDLDGVVVGDDNVAHRDSSREAVMLPTGRLLVPDCVLTYELGKSRKPYGRLWWDETVSTVVTFPHIRAQAILHPDQDRRLTIRECARLQGFPDYYRFCGTIKERYCQVGNAVSIPVSRALGYALGVAYRKVAGDEPLMTLPPDFSSMLPSST